MGLQEETKMGASANEVVIRVRKGYRGVRSRVRRFMLAHPSPPKVSLRATSSTSLIKAAALWARIFFIAAACASTSFAAEAPTEDRSASFGAVGFAVLISERCVAAPMNRIGAAPPHVETEARRAAESGCT